MLNILEYNDTKNYIIKKLKNDKSLLETVSKTVYNISIDNPDDNIKDTIKTHIFISEMYK